MISRQATTPYAQKCRAFQPEWTKSSQSATEYTMPPEQSLPANLASDEPAAEPAELQSRADHKPRGDRGGPNERRINRQQRLLMGRPRRPARLRGNNLLAAGRRLRRLRGGKVTKLSATTTKIVEDTFSCSLPNERRRSIKIKQPLPDTPYTKLDSTVQSMQATCKISKRCRQGLCPYTNLDPGC